MKDLEKFIYAMAIILVFTAFASFLVFQHIIFYVDMLIACCVLIGYEIGKEMIQNETH